MRTCPTLKVVTFRKLFSMTTPLAANSASEIAVRAVLNSSALETTVCPRPPTPRVGLTRTAPCSSSCLPARAASSRVKAEKPGNVTDRTSCGKSSDHPSGAAADCSINGCVIAFVAASGNGTTPPNKSASLRIPRRTASLWVNVLSGTK